MADFLSSLMGGANPMDFLAQVVNIGNLLGPKQNVLDSRDFSALMSQTDVNNTKNIQRQNEFLQGVTPTNAAMYNQYQDATYAQDSERQAQRIMDISKSTGMSPWELNGGSGAAPLPSPSMGSQNAPNYMANVVPLAQTQMQISGQLAATAMNNRTSKEIASMQTAGGRTAEADVALKAAQAALAALTGEKTKQDTATGRALESLTWSQGAAAENQIVLQTIQTLASLLPKTTVNAGPLSKTWMEDFPVLGQLAAKLMDKGELSQDAGMVAEFVKQLPASGWSGLKSDLVKVSKMVVETGGEMIGNIGQGLWDAGGKAADWLKGVVPPEVAGWMRKQPAGFKR